MLLQVINACERARLWQQALVALSSATAQLDPDVTCRARLLDVLDRKLHLYFTNTAVAKACLHNATIAAMQRSAQWQRALWLLQEICNSEAGVQPDVP